MQAITQDRYCTPEGLQYRKIDIPVPTDKQIQIKVACSSPNPADYHLMSADVFFIRFGAGLFKPKKKTIGIDISGVVSAVGKDVEGIKVGDEVFGQSSVHGTWADYSIVLESDIVMKPESVSFEEAGVCPVAGLTALQLLRDHGKLKEGQSVLIIGASGGVGTYAVQIAKILGCKVTGVCSTANVDLVKSLGADEVIDYRIEGDWPKQETDKYDYILDHIGEFSMSVYESMLKPNGLYCISCDNIGTLIAAGFRSKTSDGKQFAPAPESTCNTDDLTTVGEYLANGNMKSVISKTFPLEEGAEAMKLLATKHAVGKICVKIVG